jgi:hypothetical protein
VFLIGEEQILADQEIPAVSDPTTATRALGGRSSRRARSPHLRGSLQGARGLALLGLGAGAVAILATLELLGGGKGPARQATTSPSRSPLISRSAARVPAVPNARAHPRTEGHAEVHRPSAVHHRRSRHPRRPVSRPTAVIQSEPEREPTESVAPVSSAAVTATVPAQAPELAPQTIARPTPPAPPPSSSGGGPAGVESFGFER